MAAASDNAFTLIVESGLHAGTVQRLSPGIYTLGSELDADVVLSDTAVSPLHLILEIDRQGLRLEPVQGSIAIDGESVDLEPGGERYLALPLSFEIGGARIRMTAPQDVVRARRRVRMAALVTGAALLAVVGFSILGLTPGAEQKRSLAFVGDVEPLIGGDEKQTLAAVTDQQPPSPSIDELPPRPAATENADLPPVDITADEARAADLMTHDQAATELRSRLSAASLMDIDVTSNDDRILVRGVAGPDQMSAWQEVRMWFDGSFGQQFMMVADVQEEELSEPPKLAIEAIWLGDKPYVMAGGQRFHEGSAIGDGWMVEHIGSDELTFKRGDKTFSLTL